MSYEIIAQPKELIAQFVAIRQGKPATEPWGHFTAIGLLRHGALIAGVLYNSFEEKNVCMHVGAIDGAHWLTRSFLFAAFDYPFNQLGMRRVTALVPKKNKAARKFDEHIGFRYEGCLKHYFDRDDMIVYGMLREDCRWIRQKEERMAA